MVPFAPAPNREAVITSGQSPNQREFRRRSSRGNFCRCIPIRGNQTRPRAFSSESLVSEVAKCRLAQRGDERYDASPDRAFIRSDRGDSALAAFRRLGVSAVRIARRVAHHRRRDHVGSGHRLMVCRLHFRLGHLSFRRCRFSSAARPRREMQSGHSVGGIGSLGCRRESYRSTA
jgi:hypothetical protein